MYQIMWKSWLYVNISDFAKMQKCLWNKYMSLLYLCLYLFFKIGGKQLVNYLDLYFLIFTDKVCEQETFVVLSFWDLRAVFTVHSD